MIMSFMCTVPLRDIYLCHVMINAGLLLARLIFVSSDFSAEKIAVNVSCSVAASLEGTCPCQQLNSSSINCALVARNHLSANNVAVRFQPLTFKCLPRLIDQVWMAILTHKWFLSSPISADVVTTSHQGCFGNYAFTMRTQYLLSDTLKQLHLKETQI